MEPTGVTENHPYWSVDRQEFVPAGDLREGERLDTLAGTTRVASISPLSGVEFLYNIETAEHVYRVGAIGTLVHNASARTSIFARDKSGPFTQQVFPTRQRVRESGIADLRRKFLGEKSVKVDKGKWRSADGSRQFRVKPNDYAGKHGVGPHVHLEFLKPNAAGTRFDVLKNIHIPIDIGL